MNQTYEQAAIAILNGEPIPEGLDLSMLLSEISGISDDMPDGDEARTKVLVAIIGGVREDIKAIVDTLDEIRQIQTTTADIFKVTSQRLDVLEGRDG